MNDRSGRDLFVGVGSMERFKQAAPKNSHIDIRVTKAFKDFYLGFCKENDFSPGDVFVNGTIFLICFLKKPNFLTWSQRAEISELVDFFTIEKKGVDRK